MEAAKKKKKEEAIAQLAAQWSLEFGQPPYIALVQIGLHRQRLAHKNLHCTIKNKIN
jgi:hypothetical protein